MRKSTLFILAFISIASCVNAQISKGSILLGGNFGVSTQKSENTNSTNYIQKNQSFYITPTAGVAIWQNTIVGVGLSYSRNSNNDGSTLDQVSNSYGIHSFIRKYKLLGKNFYLFGEGSLGFNRGKVEIETNSVLTTQNKSSQIQLSFFPGIAYAVNRKFHLEAGLNNLIYFNYGVSHGKNPGVPNSNYKTKLLNVSTSLAGAIPLTVGFRFLFLK